MRYDPFSILPIPKPDPIFAVTAEALAAGPSAINGTIGVFMDEEGKTMLFPSVALAIADIASGLPSERYGYPPLLGLPEFRSAVERLIFADRSRVSGSIATTAGTGSLAVNLRLLKVLARSGEIYLPSPAWANHAPPCRDVGFTVREVGYLEGGKPSIGPLLEALRRRKSRRGFGVLLQVGCHNPTGLDLTPDAWKELAGFLAKEPCTALLDFAYQGFKGEPEEDARAVGVFLEAGVPTLISWSAAKNHSIYSLRTGLACAVVPDESTKRTVEGTYSMITRRLHSAAATFGQRVVARVQERYPDQWRADLRLARETMQRKRQRMKEHLPESLHSALAGYGMFAMLPLSGEQIIRLKEEHNVFLTLDGRINIAGIPLKRIEELCEKIMKVG
ncbi:MAG: aminotransferase class I/II-fold pyridoxal phosphate-dependent enzyme [Candidatus Peribacteraceae bacterium]